MTRNRRGVQRRVLQSLSQASGVTTRDRPDGGLVHPFAAAGRSLRSRAPSELRMVSRLASGMRLRRRITPYSCIDGPVVRKYSLTGQTVTGSTKR